MIGPLAALLFRPEHVSDNALSEGFAVALAGYDAPKPALLTCELFGFPGWSIAFYKSGLAAGEDELGHFTDLFDDERPPGLTVLDRAAREAVIYALVYSDGSLYDDAYRFDARGTTRRFVREGEEGLEAGSESEEGLSIEEFEDDLDEAELRRKRGTTFLENELCGPLLPALARSLFEADKRVPIALADGSPAGITALVEALNTVLGRSSGRGQSPDGVPAPASYKAFCEAYDWHDPKDPEDLYRELSLGHLKGTLRFLRAADVAEHTRRSAPKGALAVATLQTGSLGGPGRRSHTVILGADGATLSVLAEGGALKPAGATFAELLAYLSLGWKRRDDLEEEHIDALMLKAHLRAFGVQAH